MKENERRTILKWAADNGADEETMGNVRRVLDDADALEIMESADVEKALEKTKGKIRRDKAWGVAKRCAAAVSTIAACIAAAAVCLHVLHGNSDGPIYAEYSVNPGMTGTLQLPDSTVVVLNGGSKLSYSKDFSVSTPEGGKVKVTFRIRNTGKRNGATAAQVYVGECSPTLPRPKKELKGYEKIFLKSGEVKEISIILDNEAFSHYDTALHDFTVTPGKYRIFVGDSSANLTLTATVQR